MNIFRFLYGLYGDFWKQQLNNSCDVTSYRPQIWRWNAPCNCHKLHKSDRLSSCGQFNVILGLCSAAVILVPQKSNFIFDTSLTFKIDAELWITYIPAAVFFWKNGYLRQLRLKVDIIEPSTIRRRRKKSKPLLSPKYLSSGHLLLSTCHKLYTAFFHSVITNIPSCCCMLYFFSWVDSSSGCGQ